MVGDGYRWHGEMLYTRPSLNPSLQCSKSIIMTIFDGQLTILYRNVVFLESHFKSSKCLFIFTKLSHLELIKNKKWLTFPVCYRRIKRLYKRFIEKK